MMMTRKATPADLPAIMKIVAEAQRFLKEQGVDQWQSGYPGPEMFLGDMERQSSYVLTEEDNSPPVAVIAVCFEWEEVYENITEGQWLTNLPYGVIHRMAVGADSRGKGWGKELLRLAEKLCQDKGTKSLRVDTHEDNLPMRHLLVTNGFIPCGIVYYDKGVVGGERRLAFEKVLN